MRRLPFILTICFLSLPVGVRAVDYYVDADCATPGTGTSDTCTAGADDPFQTIAAAQAAVVGDQSDNSLLFNKGDTWREQFTVGAVGTLGHQFTIGAYGAGADPIISGADIISGNWVGPDGNGEYTDDSIDTRCYIVIVDGTVWTEGTIGSLGATEWDWDATDGGTLWMGADPAALVVEAGQRNNCITATSKDYITINSITVRGANQQAVLNLTGTTWIVQDCAFERTSVTSDAGPGYYGALAFEGPDSVGWVDGCTFQDTRTDGIFADGFDNLTITDGTFTNCMGLYGDGIHLNNSDDPSILRNSIDTTTVGGIKVIGGTAGEIAYNEIGNAVQGSIAVAMTTVDVHHNLTYGATGVTGVGSGIEVSNTAIEVAANIHHNVIYGCERGIYFVGGAAQGRNLDVHDNTIYSDSEEGGIMSDASNELYGNISNNIIWVPSFSLFAFRIGNIKGGETLTSDYNLIGPEAANVVYWVDTAYATLAAYVAAKSQDANSIKDDPLFTNPGAGNLTLQPNSPARHGATHLVGYEAKLRPEASWTDNVTTMIDILSIGAYGVYRGSAGM